VVGVGGLGQMPRYHLTLSHMPQTCALPLAMIGLVVAVDGLSFLARP